MAVVPPSPPPGRTQSWGFALFTRLVNHGFTRDTVSKDSLTTADVFALIQRTKECFMKEESLVYLPAPCLVMSDLHGDDLSLEKTFLMNRVFEGRPHLAFLGNHIGGKDSLKVLCKIFALKVNDPSWVAILRGDRETENEAKKHGLYEDIVEKLGEEVADELFKEFIDLFNWMPFAVDIGTKVLGVHGGISPELHSLDDIKKIPRPLVNPLSMPLVADLLLAEPYRQVPFFKTNPKNNSLIFGYQELVKTLDRLEMSLMIRGSSPCFKRYGAAALGRKLFGINTNFEHQATAAVFIDHEGRTGVVVGRGSYNLHLPQSCRFPKYYSERVMAMEEYSDSDEDEPVDHNVRGA